MSKHKVSTLTGTHIFPETAIRAEQVLESALQKIYPACISFKLDTSLAFAVEQRF